MTRAAFWDASALVPLCVPQSMSARILPLFHQFGLVWWWATPVEIASALARLLRMQQIDATVWTKANAEAQSLARPSYTIPPSDEVRTSAMDIVSRYDLRAGDALQVAAALAWCEGTPSGRVFLTVDQRLREAALLCGFDAKTI